MMLGPSLAPFLNIMRLEHKFDVACIQPTANGSGWIAATLPLLPKQVEETGNSLSNAW